MKRNNKFHYIALLMVLCTVTGVLAYFTSNERIQRGYDVGYADITIEGVGLESDIYIQGESFEGYAGTRIINTGIVPCWVRVRIDFSDYTFLDYTSFYGTGIGWISARDFKLHGLGTPPGWQYNQQDGYFYYTSPLASSNDGWGELTEPLVDNYKVYVPLGEDVPLRHVYDPNMPYQNLEMDLHIMVYAECVHQSSDDYMADWSEFLR